MLDHEVLQHLDCDLSDLSELLQGPAHFSQQEPDQEVVFAEVVRQRVILLEICGAGEQTELN